MKSKGFVLYEGPSVLDGAPIVVIAIVESKNAKTGRMIQTLIMRSDIDPVAASQSGEDGAVCGACTHRHFLGGACYVNLGQAPLSVWRAYKRGVYVDATARQAGALAQIAGRALRAGTYGDPAAVPFEVWQYALDEIKPRVKTGYTHQARHPKFDQRILGLCMASADTPKQAEKLQAMGARTFRVKTEGAEFLAGEIECLADSKGVQCIDCGLCDGKGKAPNIAINVHGSRAGRYTAKYENKNIIARV